MSHKVYGHGKTRIDLNGPYGTIVSLFRIADYWATLCGHNRVTVALHLTDPTDSMETRYEAFARFFGDYATLYYGEGKRSAGDSDPFSAWPFECRRFAEMHQKSKEQREFEDETVDYLIERYVASDYRGTE